MCMNVFLSVWVHAPGGCGAHDCQSVHQIPWNCSYRWLWTTLWVLGVKLSSSARAAGTLNCPAISPSPQLYANTVQTSLLRQWCHLQWVDIISLMCSSWSSHRYAPGPPNIDRPSLRASYQVFVGYLKLTIKNIHYRDIDKMYTMIYCCYFARILHEWTLP